MRLVRDNVLTFARVLGALAIAVVGGYIFFLLGVPLAWMLGAMSFTMMAAVARAPVLGPDPLRAPTVSVIGVLLGSGFTPEFVSEAARWPLTIAGLLVFLAAAGWAAVVFLRVVGGFDRPTAYFAGMPGGLTEMLIAGMDNGGDPRRIGLCHAARIFLVVLSVPPLLALFGYPVEAVTVGKEVPSMVDTAPTTWIWIVGCAAGGILLGYALRLPAAPFLGPMIASAVIHATGLSDFETPAELVMVAQVILGTIVGCRFLGSSAGEVGRIIVLSAGSTSIVLTFTIIFALALSAIGHHSFPAVLLAFSPGGLVEMNLVALALGIEISFVAVHHIVRVVAVMFAAPLLFAWLTRRDRKKPGE